MNFGNTYVLQHTNICISGASHFFCPSAAEEYLQPKILSQHTQPACHRNFEDNMTHDTDSTENLKQEEAESVASSFQLQIKLPGKIYFQAALNENLYN